MRAVACSIARSASVAFGGSNDGLFINAAIVHRDLRAMRRLRSVYDDIGGGQFKVDALHARHGKAAYSPERTTSRPRRLESAT